MKNKTKITVVGSGYVGMSLAVLLSQNNEVVVLDIDASRVESINNKKTTVADEDIQDFLAKKELSLRATSDKETAYKDAKFVLVATPTNYDPDASQFDTSSVDGVIRDALKHNSDALIVIKSTVPLGYTESVQKKTSSSNVIFSPEFLREGQALKDNLYPARIIIGTQLKAGKDFAELLAQGAYKKCIEVLYMSSTEAEAVKLFANSYLAMRVSFFNELDSYALSNDLDTGNIINGVCLDERIGHGYNNPSFGYGGYCLPKDTKQLLSNYEQIPQTLIQAIVSSNTIRKDFIADEIIKLKPKIVGFYRLIMKEGSDNFRSSAIQGIIRRIQARNIEAVIFEPTLSDDKFHQVRVLRTIDDFKNISDVIVTNRMDNELDDVIEKVFTRDIFRSD